MKMTTRLAAVLSSILMISAFPLSSWGEDSDDQNGEEEPILVGRLSHVEGSALRYDPDEGQWVGVAEDAPFGFNDRLKTEQDGRAEIILPNNTWVRLAEETGIELVSLTEQETAIILSHGKARFISKGSDSGFAVSTPFGDVTAPGMTVFDLQIVNESAEVIPLSGSVYYRHDPTGAAIEVKEGSNSILVDKYSLAAGKGHIDPVWEGWNTERDSLWTKRMEIGAASAKYLPPALTDHAYVLQDNGVWEEAYYEGAYEYMWRPVHVQPGWSPFAVGRWTVWYGDHVWMPGEPFGYVTHHYGSWVFVHGNWYWAPPQASVSITIGNPRWRIGFAWYPGRVAWIQSRSLVGWVPLAPHEPYYSHRHWGPRSVAVRNVRLTDSRVQKYINADYAVVVHQKDLYREGNSRNHRIQRPNRNSIAHEYKAVPVIDAGASVLPKESERGFVSGKRQISAKNARENGKPGPQPIVKPLEKATGSNPYRYQKRTQPSAPRPQTEQVKIQAVPDRGNRHESRTPASTTPTRILRGTTDKTVSTTNRKDDAKASKKEAGKERDAFKNAREERHHKSAREERSDGPAVHRLAPVSQTRSDSDESGRNGKYESQKSAGLGPTPERARTRSAEPQPNTWQTERHGNHVPNQIKKNNGRN